MALTITIPDACSKCQVEIVGLRAGCMRPQTCFCTSRSYTGWAEEPFSAVAFEGPICFYPLGGGGSVIFRMLVAASFAVPAAGGAREQPRAPEPGVFEEIIVTGERVPRALRETSSSVVVATEEKMEATGADRLDQLVALVPNVQMGSGEEGPAIRGQDSTGVLRNLFAFLGGTRPRVTLQVDGRAVSYYEYVSSSAPVWDLERVEIFRSPQTTTQGRNSIAGAIFVETNDPSFDWQGRGRFIVGSSGTRHASAVVSGPIIENQLAIRVSGDVRLSRMTSDMADGIAGADIDRDDYGLARVKLLFEPRALPGARLETSYVHTQSQAPQFEAVLAPFRKRRFPVPERTNGINRVKANSLTSRLDYRLAPGLFSTVTLSYGDALVRRFGLPGLGQTRVDSKDYSAEANLIWRPDGPVALLGGAHYVVTRQRQFIDITGLGIGAGDFRDRQGSIGLFGEATWRPITPLAFTAGLRYQRDSQDREGRVGNGPTGLGLNYNEAFHAWLPKLSVAYDLSANMTAGLMVQRAYNPGGTSISLSRRAQDSFEAETLWNYEAFVRSSFAGGQATLAANLFYNDVTGAQRQQTVPITLPNGGTIFAAEFANAPTAETYGMEAELDWRVGKRLSLRVGTGLLRTKVSKTILPADPSLGKDFQRSPGLSAAGAIDWRPLEPLRLSAQIRHHGDYFSDDANTLARRIEKATIVDARAAYTMGSVTLFGYVRNAFDALYLTYLFTPTFGTAGDPREIGVGVEARF